MVLLQTTYRVTLVFFINTMGEPFRLLVIASG